MKKYLRCFKNGRDITVGNRYEIVGETKCLFDMCYVIIDDAGERHHFTIEPDENGKSYLTWFTLETDEQPRKIDGRKAEITHPGRRFSTYTRFAIKHGYPEAAHDYSKSQKDTRAAPKEGEIVTLLVSGEHDSMYEGDTLWIVEAANGERHIFNEKGLRILDENNTLLPDESLGGVMREYREVKRKAVKGERIKYVWPGKPSHYNIAKDVRDSGDVDIANPYDSEDGEGEVVGWGAAAYVVLEPTDIIRIDNKRLRMVDRKAAVGECVIITFSRRACFTVGETRTVKKNETVPAGDAYSVDGPGYYLLRAEDSRVLEPVNETAAVSELSSLPAAEQAAENIAALAAKVQALEKTVRRMAIQLRVAQEDVVLIEEGVADDIKSLESRVAALENAKVRTMIDTHLKKSPQQIRDEIVERAKADVRELLDRNYPRSDGYHPSIWFTNKDGASITDKCEFIVNRDKRTVVALISLIGGKPFRKGIAKCAPNDVFNAHIGKAIALRRALGLEVPAEYLNVPNPTEVRVGDVVIGILSGVKAVVHHVGNGDVIGNRSGWVYGRYEDGDALSTYNFKIIDDSREDNAAVRKEVSAA
ncbi:hypothetical protein RJP21_04810 [Paenibacillus sp. VCA1]|uniref:hypothetical protein n=1 Tax=Paenibacillus sp. VCA1 TaxID=3039148 RepID=UPI002872973D|nr:hypothetical protein [Paenibacillus sp. VCA1]MDR9852921.1 hypothetical protein [Paenibacillus sp. VCA1]